MACVLYGLVIRQLLLGLKKQPALQAAWAEFAGWYERTPEFSHFKRILEDELVSLPEGEIVSTGYVLYTLHASLWSLLTTDSFDECVLKAVNLGGDTDTTGCVAGGLAGVQYALSAIRMKWLQALLLAGVDPKKPAVFWSWFSPTVSDTLLRPIYCAALAGSFEFGLMRCKDLPDYHGHAGTQSRVEGLH